MILQIWLISIILYLYLNIGKRCTKRKSGGIGIYVRKEIAQYINTLENSSEYVLWVSVDKSLMNLNENLILGTVYLPFENSRFFDNDQLDDFKSEITNMCNQHKYVMLAGDTNARTGNLKDFVDPDTFFQDYFDFSDVSDEFFNKHIELENLSIPLDRCNSDYKTNTHGFRLIDICRNNNIFILNGRLFKDKNRGNFTFRDLSVIDYVISSTDCLKHVINFEVIEIDTLFSDGHCAINWEMQYSLPKLTLIEIHANPKQPVWVSTLINEKVTSTLMT